MEDYEDRKFLEQYKKGYLARDFVVNPALFKVLGDIKGKKILDLGCGVGILSRAMADNGADVLGVDISKESIKFFICFM